MTSDSESFESADEDPGFFEKEVDEKAKTETKFDSESKTPKNKDAPVTACGWDEIDDESVLKDIESKLIDTHNEKVDSHSFEEANKTEKRSTPAEKQTLNNRNSNWSSWSGWDVTSLISTATEGVSSLSNHMTSGISTVLENSLSTPILSQTVNNEDNTERISQRNQPQVSELFGLGDIIGGVSNLGSKVIAGGLDTLETLGKKTMEVLQEGDPGLKKKRALLFQSDRPVLSEILRDAREKSEFFDNSKLEDQKVRMVHYDTLFDDFHGLVHLEALEMISKQCELKIETQLAGNSDEDDIGDILEQVKELCKLPDDNYDEEQCLKLSEDGIKETIEKILEPLNLPVSAEKILEFDSSFKNKSLGTPNLDNICIHKEAITDLANFTAISMEFFHRFAESLLLIDHNRVTTESESLIRVISLFKSQINSITEWYNSILLKEGSSSSNDFITNIFLEGSNSITYIENAYSLFLPVFQLAALK